MNVTYSLYKYHHHQHYQRNLFCNLNKLTTKNISKYKSSRRFQIRNSISTEKQQEQEEDIYYPGIYGKWKIESKDKIEVISYRIGLTITAISLIIGTSISYLRPENEIILSVYNPLCILGTTGLGISLYLIHVYVTPLKRFIQGLWAIGTIGGLWLMITHNEQPLPLYVANHPESVWFIGPVFASITGLAVKEGLCYGKLEAALLVLIVPSLMLGHLTGITDNALSYELLWTFVVLFAIFAGRKYTQKIKDDIGDKSVFEFMKLSEEKQKELLIELSEND